MDVQFKHNLSQEDNLNETLFDETNKLQSENTQHQNIERLYSVCIK